MKSITEGTAIGVKPGDQVTIVHNDFIAICKVIQVRAKDELPPIKGQASSPQGQPSSPPEQRTGIRIAIQSVVQRE